MADVVYAVFLSSLWSLVLARAKRTPSNLGVESSNVFEFSRRLAASGFVEVASMGKMLAGVGFQGRFSVKCISARWQLDCKITFAVLSEKRFGKL